MESDCDNSFPFDFEPNVISFGSKSKGKLSPRSYAIQLYSFLSVFRQESQIVIATRGLTGARKNSRAASAARERRNAARASRYQGDH